jgi:hypothetical protein
VEQKNWSVVRHTVGYDRFESQAELALLNSIYEDLRLYVNFFQPVRKVIGKETVNQVTRKNFDTSRTPYQRVLEQGDIAEADKAHLRDQYNSLNPGELRRSLENKTARMLKIVW